MRNLFILALLCLSIGVSAQRLDTAAAKLPPIGIRAGVVSGRLVPTNDRSSRYRAQVGWEAAVELSNNQQLRAGLQMELGVNCLRFTDRPDAFNGASYRWINIQPALVAFVRPVHPLQLLGGVGVAINASCWRFPFHSYPGGYSFDGDYASNTESASGGLFSVLGLRGAITPHLFAEGRYVRTTLGGVHRYKSEITGHTGWWSLSVGYWLNPRPAAPTRRRAA